MSADGAQVLIDSRGGGIGQQRILGDSLQENIFRVAAAQVIQIHVGIDRARIIAPEIEERAEHRWRRPERSLPALAEIRRPRKGIQGAAAAPMGGIARVLRGPKAADRVQDAVDRGKAHDLSAECRDVLRIGRRPPHIFPAETRFSMRDGNSGDPGKAETHPSDIVVVAVEAAAVAPRAVLVVVARPGAGP